MASGIFSKIGSFFKTAGKDLVSLVKNIITTFTKLKDLWSEVTNLIQSAKDEIDGWKHFKEDIRLKSRVVNLETAFQKTRDLVEGIPASWHAVLDLFSQIKSALAKDVAEEEGAALLAVETAGLSEVAVAIAIIYQVLSFVESVVSDLQTILDEAKRLRLEVEKLDTVFLQQDNKRKTVKLESGKTIKIRVGKLHASA
jgi:conjugal transfer/entry exclusion protein